MTNDKEKSLEQILRELPWSAIWIPLALGLIVVIAIVIITVRGGS